MGSDWSRKIIHIDMDAFFAAIEQRDRPELRGKPVIVGGDPGGRGVVSTASYEARRFGVHSAMPASRARRLCPQGIFLRPHFEKYKEVSDRIMNILQNYASQIEPAGLDEAYLDVTTNKLQIEDPVRLAELIKQHIQAVTHLTASAGVAPNKFLAKIASDFTKPDGLTVIPPEGIEQFLEPLPVRKIPGVGPVTEARLAQAGIKTCGDLLPFTEKELAARFGKFGCALYELARGIDDSPVVTTWEPKQASSEETFPHDLTDLATLEAELRALAEEVAARLSHEGRTGRTITLKVRYSDFTTVTRSFTLSHPVHDAATIMEVATRLLRERTEAGKRPVRLLGVGVAGLTPLEPPAPVE